MPSLHFHPVYAWNLVEDLGQSAIIPSQALRHYPERKLHEGRQAGWVNEESKRIARWMFVFADGVVLPGEVDVPVGAVSELYDTKALTWGEDLLPGGERAILRPEYDPDLDTSWAERLASLMHHPGIDRNAIEATIDWWRRRREFEERAKRRIGPVNEGWNAVDHSGLREAVARGTYADHLLWQTLDPTRREGLLKVLADDPLREQANFAAAQQAISDVVGFARLSDRFASRGCPTLTASNLDPVSQMPSDPSSYDALVRFYFERVRIPAPETAEECMRLRANDRVVEWRKKIDEWQKNLQVGRLDLKAVRDEIDDASGYLEGARGLRTAIGYISPWFTFGLAVLLEAVPDLPGKHELQMGLLSVEGLRLATKSVESSVTGPNPLQYKWMMLEPPKESE
jgi:hypothetical protein